MAERRFNGRNCKVPNKNFDQKVVAAGYCCAHSFIRILVRPEDSISKIAKMADVCTATVKNQRKRFREGNLPCARRDTCLRVLWLTQRQINKDDNDAAKAKAKAEAKAEKEEFRASDKSK